MNIIMGLVFISDQFGMVPCTSACQNLINILVKTGKPSILSLYLTLSKFTGHQIPHECHSLSVSFFGLITSSLNQQCMLTQALSDKSSYCY